MFRVSWKMGGRLHAVLSSVDLTSAHFIRTSLHRSFAVYRQRNPLIPLCLAGKEGIPLHVGSSCFVAGCILAYAGRLYLAGQNPA
jgi:hypothetical protein